MKIKNEKKALQMFCSALQLVLMPMANTCNFKQEIRIEMEE